MQSSLLTGIKEEVALLHKYPMLAKATSDNEEPTPGYLYDSIISLSFESRGTYCESLLNYLLSQLQKDSPHVQLKVLKIFKHLTEKGHPSIIQELRKRDHILKAAAKASGPPHPLMGMAPYSSVRTTAKELLTFLFREPDMSFQDTSNVQKLATFDEKASLPGYGSSASGSTLHGFGTTQTFSGGAGKSFIQGMSMTADQTVQTADVEVCMRSLGASLPRYEPICLEHRSLPDNTVDTAVPSQDGLKGKMCDIKPRIKAWTAHVPGKAGGGWDEERPTEPIPSEVDEGRLFSVASGSSNPSTGSQDNTEASSSPDWTEEARLVDDYISGEAKFPLSRTEINEMCKRCSALNCDKIIELIAKTLVLKGENAQLRLLLLLEAMFRQDLAVPEIAAKTIAPSLRILMDAPLQSVRAKAKKMLLSLNHLYGLDATQLTALSS